MSFISKYFHAQEIWGKFGKFWENLGKIWENLGKFGKFGKIWEIWKKEKMRCPQNNRTIEQLAESYSLHYRNNDFYPWDTLSPALQVV